eukprot:scaffold44128_cov75-Cyclotella_meneghiniana.AAC.13
MTNTKDVVEGWPLILIFLLVGWGSWWDEKKCVPPQGCLALDKRTLAAGLRTYERVQREGAKVAAICLETIDNTTARAGYRLQAIKHQAGTTNKNEGRYLAIRQPNE